MSPTPGSRLYRIFTEVRDGRRAVTAAELTAVLKPEDYDARQVAVLLWWLADAGYLSVLPGPWWARRYVLPRLARWFRV